MKSEWDPSTPDGHAHIGKDTHISDTYNGYFGVGACDSMAYNYTRNQVFNESDFAIVINKLQDAQATGNGAVATTTLTTVENKFWGIPSGFQVTLCWIYIGRTFNWEAALPPELKKLVVPTGGDALDPVKTMRHGPFQNFPHYKTRDLELTHPQANLLAQLTTWVVEQHAEEIMELLA